MRMREESVLTGLSREEQHDRRVRDDALRDVPVVVRWDQRWEPEYRDANGALFGPTTEPEQTHERLVVTVPFEILCLPPCRIEGLTMTASGRVRGARFTGPVGLAAGTVTAIFADCTFDVPVVVVAGARAHFVGCTFQGTAAVQNSGAAGNVGIVGCSRTSGVAHVAVTTVFETT